ncbi:alcohol dehydrogenase catalytic domain-containing protein [Thauera butanivorans]|uniref:alcohol dehydrogenase catalytic domain-containing protein n=1 Tax=Thauera butanivorans TaxID=86174 RepID=UPI0008391B63|nr:alcohol dehydrogenase catalytic domain-containing protein [Thauera butanivorans]
MKAITLKAPGGLVNIAEAEVADPGRPGKGEIRVAIKASSLNYHDLLVACAAVPTEDGRILLSDGAGTVAEVGEGVTEFRPGDHVVSTFFPVWPAGPANLPILLALARHARIEGLIVGSRRDQQDFVRALELMEARPIIDQVFSYTDLAAAFAHQQSGQHFGKICVEW